MTWWVGLESAADERLRETSWRRRQWCPFPSSGHRTLKTYWVSKGSAFSTSVSKQEAELSPEMISRYEGARGAGVSGPGWGGVSPSRPWTCLPHSGSWRDRPFKPYNFSARGVLPDSGHLHPLLKVRTQFRQIFLEMG